MKADAETRSECNRANHLPFPLPYRLPYRLTLRQAQVLHYIGTHEERRQIPLHYSWFIPTVRALIRRGLLVHDGYHYYQPTAQGEAFIAAVEQMRSIEWEHPCHTGSPEISSEIPSLCESCE